MKNLLKSLFVGVLLFTNLLASAEITSVSTIADAKKLNSGDSIYFSGELTLQYVAISSAGIDFTNSLSCILTIDIVYNFPVATKTAFYPTNVRQSSVKTSKNISLIIKNNK
jgi:hypothetical protein